MVNSEIKLIIFSKDGEALYSQQKQNQEMTGAQIMNSLLPNSDLKWRKWGKPVGHSGMTKIKALMTIQWKWQIESMDYLISARRTMDGGLWHCTGGSDQDHPQEKEMQKAKWLSEEALQIAVKRREAKGKGKKERYTHLNAEF